MLIRAQFLTVILFSIFSASVIAAENKLKAISFDEWNQVLSEQHGKIVVVDMWAMWCTSCIERFPKMVEISNRYNKNQVSIIGLNLDDREDTLSLKMAEEFLHKVKANFANYHLNENLMEAFSRLNLIGIPAVIIYDRQGNEFKRLTGDNPNKQFSDKDIDHALKNLL
jgi:thiol-disulfide isomerase/thioredoxin